MNNSNNDAIKEFIKGMREGKDKLNTAVFVARNEGVLDAEEAAQCYRFIKKIVEIAIQTKSVELQKELAVFLPKGITQEQFIEQLEKEIDEDYQKELDSGQYGYQFIYDEENLEGIEDEKE